MIQEVEMYEQMKTENYPNHLSSFNETFHKFVAYEMEHNDHTQRICESVTTKSGWNFPKLMYSEMITCYRLPRDQDHVRLDTTWARGSNRDTQKKT